jgi:DUF1680 family protein
LSLPYYKVKPDFDGEVKARLIAYFSWANREEQDMNIWFARS